MNLRILRFSGGGTYMFFMIATGGWHAVVWAFAGYPTLRRLVLSGHPWL